MALLYADKINIFLKIFSKKIIKKGYYFLIGKQMYSYLGKSQWSKMYLLRNSNETLYK